MSTPRTPAAEPRRDVRLLGLPVAEFLGLQVHFDDVVRELQLIEVGRSQGLTTSGALRALAVEVQHDISGDRRRIHEQALAAQASGDDTVDVVIDLGPRAVADVGRLVGLVEEVDAQSRAGNLLTPPAPPRLLDLLRWLADEVAGQLRDGRPPRPYARST